MSIRQGNNIIASSGVNNLSLLDIKWSDHKIDDLNWILSSDDWYSGTTYKKIYKHLIDDITTNAVDKYYGWTDNSSEFALGWYYTLSQEPKVGDIVYASIVNNIAEEQDYVASLSGNTITLTNGTIITRNTSKDYNGICQMRKWYGDKIVVYTLAKDGHRIVSSTQETTMTNLPLLYESLGTIWYYVLDEDIKRFKLPRTKHAFTGLRHGVGSYVEAGLPNITGDVTGIRWQDSNNATGVFQLDSNYGATGYVSGSNGNKAFNFDASRSSSIYGNSTTVQPPATEMYLYFYADQFTDGSSGKNLTDSTKNIAKWSTNVTNCITEIPQDLNLELNNGVVTLKSGSKLYIPNGFEQDGTTKKFDVVITTEDKTFESNITNSDSFFIYYCTWNNNLAFHRITSQTGSGTSTPTSSYWLYYNTNDNIIYDIGNGSVAGTTSFPLCQVTTNSSGLIITIDQIFNGFGYIGSTLFTLPGVKGLIPNGRNDDGTLKNIEFESTQVWVRSWSSNPNYKDLSLATNGIGINTHRYDETENYVYNAAGNRVLDRIVFGRMEYSSTSPYNVTSFVVKNSFHALDYNDSSYISQCSMPSLKYIELSLGTSESIYTAPANGYFAINFPMGTNSSVAMEIQGTGMGIRDRTTNNDTRSAVLFLPCLAKQKVKVSYNNTGTVYFFRFIYAEGEL